MKLEEDDLDEYLCFISSSSGALKINSAQGEFEGEAYNFDPALNEWRHVTMDEVMGMDIKNTYFVGEDGDDDEEEEEEEEDTDTALINMSLELVAEFYAGKVPSGLDRHYNVDGVFQEEIKLAHWHWILNESDSCANQEDRERQFVQNLCHARCKVSRDGVVSEDFYESDKIDRLAMVSGLITFTGMSVQDERGPCQELQEARAHHTTTRHLARSSDDRGHEDRRCRDLEGM